MTDKKQHKKEEDKTGIPILGGLFYAPKEMATTVSFISSVAYPAIRQAISKQAINLIVGNHEDRRSKATKVVYTIGCLSPFFMDFANFYHSGSEFYNDLGKLENKIAPVLQAEYGKISIMSLKNLADNNEVVGVSMEKDKHIFKANLLSNAAGLLSSAPQAYIAYKDFKSAKISGNMSSDELENKIKELEGKPKHKKTKSLADLQRAAKKNHSIDAYDPETWATLIGESGSQLLKGKVSAERKEISGKKIVLDKILDLQNQLEDNPSLKIIDGKPLAIYIKSIFEQHQEDMGRSAIGERYQEKLTYACEQITNSIQSGKLGAMALIPLVGEAMVVKEYGKKIATRTDIDTAIASMEVKYSPPNIVDIKEYFDEAAVTIEEIKQYSQKLPVREKSVYLSLIPADILEKIPDIKDNETSIDIDNLENLVRDLALYVKNNEGKLKVADVTNKDIKLIKSVASQLEKEGFSAIKDNMLKYGEFEKSIEYAAINIKPYWDMLISENKNIGDYANENGKNSSRNTDKNVGKNIDDYTRKEAANDDYIPNNGELKDSKHQGKIQENLRARA